MRNLNIDQVEKSLASQEAIAVVATFTAEPIEETLAFWIQELELSYKVEFAPYNQVFQQLLNPASLLSRNQKGVNIVLVRLEDWQRVEDHGEAEPSKASEDASALDKVSRNAQDLVMALKSAAMQSSTPHIVCLCPASPTTVANAARMAVLQQAEEMITAELADVGSLYLLTSQDLAAYPVEDYYDPQGDKLGHIPFTATFFTALGSAIARKIHAIKAAPYKVIVLDCDNTLWKGIVGEDGVMGIKISPAWKSLQELMLAQQAAGMIICLCSKNNEADVVEVFEQRSDMSLKREHIVSWRINWMPKSENIKSLAQELNLGLDSFIFIDDNPMECAEVQASCPEVLTLQLPGEADIPRFLQHVWAFDRLKVTDADKQRTALYKQNSERDRFQKSALTIEDFLAGLALKVEISEPSPNQLARVAQLTQRTNQFNFTTIRRSESEVQQLAQAGLECRVVEVSDRFGGYGLVGVMIFGTDDNTLSVDTFLLSCRVLGRGVEHRMLTHLAEIAKERGLNYVNVLYNPTQKNQPALTFLDSIGSDFKHSQETHSRFQFPVEFAAALSYQPGTAEPTPTPDAPTKAAKVAIATPQANKSIRMGRIVNELYDAEKILKLIESQQRQQPQPHRVSVVPRTETEQKLANIWKQLLRLEQVGIHDDFFEMGGTSLLGVSLFSQIETTFGKNLPLTTLLQAPTIEKLTHLIDQEEGVSWSPLVALQPNGDKPPLFCPHAAGGNVIIYRNLAPYLGEDQPLYGLQPKGLDGKEAPLTRFEDVADYYIEAMRSIQPEGPYYVAGLSSGGRIAMAIAHKLLSQGQRVGLLGLFDTQGPGYPKLLPATSAPRYIFNRFREIFDNHWNNLRLLTPKQKVSYIQERVKIIPREIMKMIREFYWRTGRKLPPALQKVQEANRKALKVHTPQVYPGKVTLFRAAKQPVGCVPTADLGWGDRVSGGIEIHEVPGYHAGVITEPHVRILGTKLKACLEKAQAEAQAAPTTSAYPVRDQESSAQEKKDPVPSGVEVTS